MTFADGTAWRAVAVRRVDLDDHTQVRYLHARAMRAQCGDALSDLELATFIAFVESPGEHRESPRVAARQDEPIDVRQLIEQTPVDRPTPQMRTPPAV